MQVRQILMAGAANVGDFASAIGIRTEDSSIIAELKAGSEDAYAWLVENFINRFTALFIEF